MAPRVARCCHRGARALLPPARHQAGLLGRPRAPRVPAEMGDRRGARYAPFRLPFSPRTRAFAFFASPVGRAKAATRARDLRVGEFRDERAHRFARDGPLLTSPSPRLPSPFFSYLQLGLRRSPTWSKNWRRYATAGRTASWTCQVRILRGDTTRRDRTEAPEPCAGWRRAPRAATPVGGARRAPPVSLHFQKRFLRRSRIRRRSRFPKTKRKGARTEAPRTVRDSRKFFYDSNVMRGFFWQPETPRTPSLYTGGLR